MLSIKNLTASIEGKTILKDISLDFAAGKVYALIGPNGSGKSSLANVIIGHPNFVVDAGDMTFSVETQNVASPDSVSTKHETQDLASLRTLSVDERARLGLFLSFQSPLAISGVTAEGLLRLAVGNRINPAEPDGRGATPEKLRLGASALEVRQSIEKYAEELRIAPELLRRSLNDGFSGGERKKMEALQWALLEPKLAIWDEVDTGVDVDALKTIGEFLKKHKQENQTFVFITHSTKLLEILQPDETIVIKNGSIERQGDGSLAIEIIEREGFEKK
jgi:Fe-S cluster assembly ATP-binding protein